MRPLRRVATVLVQVAVVGTTPTMMSPTLNPIRHLLHHLRLNCSSLSFWEVREMQSTHRETWKIFCVSSQITFTVATTKVVAMG
jgi:hypothetical protein